ENHLFRMHRFHGVERDCEVAGVLDVDQKFGPALRLDRSHRAELLCTIGYKGLEPHLDFLFHDCSLELVRLSTKGVGRFAVASPLTSGAGALARRPMRLPDQASR